MRNRIDRRKQSATAGWSVRSVFADPISVSSSVMGSKAATVSDYLADLPPNRRAVLESVRQVILENLGTGYAEGMQDGMIGYFVPHARYPAGYHCDPRQPLPFAALAAQKKHFSLHLMCLSEPSAELNRWFLEAWAKSGQKLDMGKCCIRFQDSSDPALDVSAALLQHVPVEQFIAFYEAARLAQYVSTHRDKVVGGQMRLVCFH